MKTSFRIGSKRWPLLVALMAVAGALWVLATMPRPLGAQQEPALQAPRAPAPPSQAADPSEDILIEGLGFSKLILAMEVAPALENIRGFEAYQSLLEKNLCWSGLFNLLEGRSAFCQLERSGGASSGRVDMRLQLAQNGNQIQLRLRDSGTERLVLWQKDLPTVGQATEADMVAALNEMAERITGQPGLLGTAIAYVMRQQGYAKIIVATDTHGLQLRRISNNQAINLLPRFARNGEWILYTVLGREGSQVYLHDLRGNPPSGTRSRFLSLAGTLNSGGAFSPDMRQMVLTLSVGQDADLYLVDMPNGQPRQLTRRPGIETQADWSPDGKYMVFVSDRTKTPQIYLREVGENDELRLTFDSSYNADPRFSRDGQNILFTKRVNGVDQIYIMDLYGENVRPVTRGMYDSEQAEWSPDGNQIVFSSNRTGEFKLYVVSADGSSLRRLTRSRQGIEESSPSWSLRPLWP